MYSYCRGRCRGDARVVQNTRNDTVNSLGLFEAPYGYHQKDLDSIYQEDGGRIPNGTSPIRVGIDGGGVDVVDKGKIVQNDEFAGDIQVAIPLVYPQTVITYRTDDLPQYDKGFGGFLNTFLNDVDGSYCDFCVYGICGDDPKLDPHYPDKVAGGYNGTRECGTKKLTRVVSISYAGLEATLPVKYQRRQCKEFAKLALQGHDLRLIWRSRRWNVSGAR